FVGGVETGEVLEPPGPRLGVQPLGVSAYAFLQRRVDKYFEKSGGTGQLADHAALCAKRRDERTDYDEPRLGHQFCDLADPSDVLDPVGVGEAEIAVETVPNIVAVEQHCVAAEREQLF